MRGWSRVTTKEIDKILDGSPIERPDSELSTEVPASRRPALVRLSMDVEQLVDELETGFQSREEILRWARRMIPRTLGEIPTSFYAELGTQFRGVLNDERERTLLAALLVDRERTLEIDPTAVDSLRRRLAVDVIEPAYARAFRELRDSATEYVDESGDGPNGDSEHSPAKQRYIAMRPVFDELDEYQRVAIDCLLGDVRDPDDVGGLEDIDGVRRWGTLLHLATHGEIEPHFIGKCVRQESTLELLTADPPSTAQQRARELFAAFYLLPRYNDGVRDLRSRAKEEPSAERAEKEVPSI